ncbi:GNAT family N-acetyltransferase [Vibrio fluvialis]|uniref:GNAT family N-acetyltransferase n=1 Tax=Vibrio fluvialis TaxID=676 RepID=UPI0025747204|nr:GNAT family protein [Vibrio fluvialis]BEI22391.1 GNAT family protein [Vibrio fluvialis]
MLKGQKTNIRAIELQDLERINAWANDLNLWVLLGGWHFPYSTTNTKNWIENINCNDKSNQYFAIANETNEIIGTISLTSIDWKNRGATYGIMIGDARSRGKGYAKDAVDTLIKYVFEELGLVRIESDIIDSNTVSLNFHLKNGWIKEGEKKYADYRGGKWHKKINIAFTLDEYTRTKK